MINLLFKWSPDFIKNVPRFNVKFSGKNFAYLFFAFFGLPFLIISQNSMSILKTKKVLFIGNSYTYFNNLPDIINNIALSFGDTLAYDSYCQGGYTLQDHFNDVNALNKINSTNWDYVVLQAQSQEPSFPPTLVSQQTTPFVIKLDSVIKKNNVCSNTVFYETWGRKNGDASNCNFYPAVCTYTGMQDRLWQSYKLFADSVHGIISPVGEAFRKSIVLNPTLDLYIQDQSHPSLEGSYLAASVFYELIFQKSVLSNTYNPGISSATVIPLLQQVAHSTIKDSLDACNIGKNVPWADFNFSSSTTFAYSFSSLSPLYSNKWYFGDGTTSLLASPNHTYASVANYIVSHVVSDNCKKDSVSKTISILPTDISQNNKLANQFTIYPNPAIDFISIKLDNNLYLSSGDFAIKNHVGQVIMDGNINKIISLSSIAAGVYFVEFTLNQATYRQKLIIQK